MTLRTFCIPDTALDREAETALGLEMIDAWRTAGIFQIEMDDELVCSTRAALAQSRRFFRLPRAAKQQCVSELSYSGYVASGEELTAGERDAAEIFTVCADVSVDDKRCAAGWPCHGPVPWPDPAYQRHMTEFMQAVGGVGRRVLRLLAAGLGLPDPEVLNRWTDEGWHHMRVLRFPTAGGGMKGIGAHTDYGLLVLAAQDDVGGLYIRPPVPGEPRNRNWLMNESSAGMYEHDEPWTFVPPVPRMLTAFPGDMLQYVTQGLLLSTPHKVKLHPSRERYALAYFHEPAFDRRLQPLWADPSARPGVSHIDYGVHFTNMFMRCYPERPASRRIAEQQSLPCFQAHMEALYATRRQAATG